VLSLRVAGAGVVGGQVRVAGKGGKLVAWQQLCAGVGRGGHGSPEARFALAPGRYDLEVRYSSGAVRTKEVLVGTHHLKHDFDELLRAER
jgi:hypothetical protein